jgi:hypothetical protein
MNSKEESPGTAKAMGIQTIVVFIGVAAALGASAVAVASGASMRAVGFIAVGFVPLMWALTHLIEKLIRRDVWEYSAPYPYRRMRLASVDVRRPPTTESEQQEVQGERRVLVAAA